MDALLRRMLRLPGRAAAGNGCWFYIDRLEVWLQEAAEVRAGLLAARERSVDPQDIRVIGALLARLDQSVAIVQRRIMRPV